MRLTSAIAVTILSLLGSGCAFVDPYIEKHFQESCQSHAYSQMVLVDYIQNRFAPNAPVRIGILPATAPANMNHFYYENISGGLLLANRIHQDLLNHGTLPIVEIFNRPEWPGKREEFFSGNFNSIRAAREAGYDFVVISYIEPMRNIEDLSAYTRVVETSSGTTIYYGKSTAHSMRPDYNRAGSKVRLNSATNALGLTTEKPSTVPLNDLFDQLGQCISQAIMKDSTTPR